MQATDVSLGNFCQNRRNPEVSLFLILDGDAGMKKSLLSLALLAGLYGAPAGAETLLDIYLLAQQKDPQYKSAEYEREAVKELYPQARAQLLPSITFGASAYKEWNEGSGVDNTNSGYALQLVQPLYNRANTNQLNQAEMRIQRAEADFLSVEQVLVMKTALRYFNVLAALDGLAYARNNKNAIQKQLDQSKQRFDVGLIAITDVQESQAGYDLAVADEILAQSTLDNAREALRELTGLYHDPLALLNEDIPLVMPEPADIDAWTQQALEQNPQLTAAQVSVDLALEEIERQRAGHLPTVDLVAKHSYSDVDSNYAISDTYRHSNSIGVQLNVPLYLGGAVESRIREAGLRRDQSLESLESSRRAVQLQAHQAYQNVLSGISRVEALRQAVVSTQTAYDATQAGFEVGTRTSVDVLAAQRELLRAQRDYAGARYQYVMNHLSLKQAAGILSAADIEKINKFFYMPSQQPAKKDKKPKPKLAKEQPKAEKPKAEAEKAKAEDDKAKAATEAPKTEAVPAATETKKP
jgi:outer membrane protein